MTLQPRFKGSCPVCATIGEQHRGSALPCWTLVLPPDAGALCRTVMSSGQPMTALSQRAVLQLDDIAFALEEMNRLIYSNRASGARGLLTTVGDRI